MRNPKKLSRHEPEFVLRTGQALPTRAIIAMLCRYGFEEKGQEGSHIKLEQRETGRVFIIPDGTTDLFYQREAAKICLEIREAKKNSQQIKLQENFSQSTVGSRPPKINLREAIGVIETLEIGGQTCTISLVPEGLPENLTSIETIELPGSPSVVALRAQGLPFLGIIAPVNSFQPEAENRLKEFSEKVNDFSKFLEEITRKYGMLLYQNLQGSHILHQPDYDIELELPVYNGLNETDARTEILEFVKEVSHLDTQIQGRLKSLLERAEKDGIVKKEPGKNGMVDWTLKKTHEITGKRQDFKITTSPEFRVLPSMYDSYIEDLFRFEIAGFDEPKYFSNIMNQYYGAEVHRPREGKKLGSKLVITHPFFPRIRYEMPVASEIPRTKTYFQKLRHINTEDDILEIGCTLQKALNDMSECQVVYDKIRVTLNALVNTSIDRYRVLYAGTMSLAGSSYQTTRAEKFGDHGVYTFTNPAFSEPVNVNVICVASKKDRSNHCIIPDPHGLDKWQETLSQARKKIAAGLKEPPQSSAHTSPSITP